MSELSLLVHSRNGCYNQSWARLKPGSRSSLDRPSKWREPKHWPVVRCLCRPISREPELKCRS